MAASPTPANGNGPGKAQASAGAAPPGIGERPEAKAGLPASVAGATGPPPPPGYLIRTLSLATPSGLLLLLALGWLLSWASFAVLNIYCEGSVYHRLKSYPPFRPEEKLECYARAMGKDLNVGPAPTHLDGNGPPSRLREKDRNLLRDWVRDTRYRVVGHEELQRARAGRAPWHELGDSEDVPREGGPSFAVVWRSTPAVGKPAAAPGDLPFVYVLEIRFVGGDQFRIEARYFPVIAGEERRSGVKDFFTVLDRPTYPVAALQPCAVNHSTAELAARFVEQMKADTRGEPAVSDRLLKDRAEAQEVQTFIEQILLRRLGEERPAGNDTRRLRTDREYWTLEQLTVWPRRLQGSDYLGFIQFLTVVAFWATAVTAAAQWAVVLNQKHYLENSEVFSVSDAPIDLQQVEQRVTRIEQLREQYRRPQGWGATIACVPLEIAYSGYCGLLAANLRPEGVPSFVQTRAAICLERSGSRQWLLRFLVWLIPSLGFIGTVVGIGDALLGTGEVLTSNPLQQQAAIQAIAGKLGTAFDTTFVALILSIISMFLINSIQKGEEELVHRSSERTLNALIDPDQIPASAAGPAPASEIPAPPGRATPSPGSVPSRTQRVILRRRTVSPIRRRLWADLLCVVLALGLLMVALTVCYSGRSGVAETLQALFRTVWEQVAEFTSNVWKP